MTRYSLDTGRESAPDEGGGCRSVGSESSEALDRYWIGLHHPPLEVLESVGCSPAVSTDHVRLITGSGYLIVPRVQTSWFQCLGQKIDQMAAVAHTLPFGSLVDGLLGMDFLRSLHAGILIAEGVIELP
jgi:hypothetical protein